MTKRAPLPMIEGPLTELTGNHQAIYVFTPPIGFDAEGAERLHVAWRKIWERAGRELPQLLVLPPFSRLEALTEGALKDHGLMRITACPNPPTAKSSAPAKTPRSRTRTATSGG
jgi:hypothetical protein